MFFKLNIGPKLIWKMSHDLILKNTFTFCFKQDISLQTGLLMFIYVDTEKILHTHLVISKKNLKNSTIVTSDSLRKGVKTSY